MLNVHKIPSRFFVQNEGVRAVNLLHIINRDDIRQCPNIWQDIFTKILEKGEFV